MKKLSYLTLSIVLHGSVLGLLFYFSVKTLSSEPIPLELVLSKPAESVSERSVLKKVGSHKTGLQQADKAGLKVANETDLAKNILEASGNSFQVPARESDGNLSTVLNDNKLYTDAQDNVFGSNDNWAFHQQVYLKVDSELIFDGILARYNHFGSVYLEFAVDSKGYLLERTLKASAEDAILKVHAVRALRKALNKEFEQTKWSVMDKPVIFRAKFEFTHEDPTLNFKKQKGFSEPIFVFRRSTNEADIASFKPKDQTLGISDAFDWEEASKKIKARQSNRLLKAGQYDPFESYRVDPAYRL